MTVVLGVLAALGWFLLLRQGRITGAWIEEVVALRAEALGYREAALHNKAAAEELEEQGEALTYELALLRSACFTMPADPDGAPGELDVRA